MNYEKFVGLFDIHYPENIDLSCVHKFLSDFKPDTLVYGGDCWDCDPISHWGEQQRFKEKGLAQIRKELNEQAEGLRELIVKQIKISKAKNVYYIIGNHEAWIAQYQSTYGNAGEPITLDGLLNLKKLGVKIVSQGDVVKLGKLYITHGENVGSNVMCARKAVQDYQKPLVFGHYHTVQAYSNVSPVDVEDPQVGYSIGCLCHKNPDYGKNKPNKWINGFVCGYVNKSTGLFTIYPITIVHNKFVWNGKEYK